MVEKNKLLTKLIRKFINIIFIIPKIIIYLGLAIIAYNLYSFFWNNTTLYVSIEILISVIIVTATLSVVSFTYISAIKKKNEICKEIFYCGERFLHATILIIISLMIFGFVGNVYPSLETLGWSRYTTWFFYSISLLAYVSLFNAAGYITYGLFKLERILYEREMQEGDRANNLYPFSNA